MDIFPFIIIIYNLILAYLMYNLMPYRDKYFLNPMNTFIASFLYFGVFQPISSYSDYSLAYGESVVIFTMMLYGVGAFFVLVGSKFVGYFPVGRHTNFQKIELNANDKSILFTGLFTLILGISLFSMLIYAHGGWSSYFERDELRRNFEDINQYLSSGPQIIIFSTMILQVYAIHKKHKILLTFTILMFSMQLIWFTYSGSRSSVLLILSMAFASWYVPNLRRPSISKLVMIVALIVMLVGFIGSYRSNFGNLEFGVEDSPAEMISKSFSFMAPDAESESRLSIREDFGMATAVVRHVPEDVPYNFGAMYAQLFTQAIPKSVWAGKVYPEGEAWHVFHLAADTSSYTNSVGYLTGPAPTYVGKYYYCGGLLGVIIGGLFAGILLRIAWVYVLGLSGATRSVFMIIFAPIGFMEANNPGYWITFWLPTAGIVLIFTRIFRKLQIRGSRKNKKNGKRKNNYALG